MNHKFLTLPLLCLLSLTAFTQRTKYNFNSNWKVFTGDTTGAESVTFNDAGWKAVTLPYAWNEDDAFRKDISQPYHRALPGTARSLPACYGPQIKKYLLSLKVSGRPVIFM